MTKASPAEQGRHLTDGNLPQSQARRQGHQPARSRLLAIFAHADGEICAALLNHARMTQTVPCTVPDMMQLTCSMVSAEACTAEEGCCITAWAAACAAALAALATVWAAEDSLVAWLMAGMLPGMLREMEAPPAVPGVHGGPTVQPQAQRNTD